MKTKKAKKTNPWIIREIIQAKRKVKTLCKTLKIKATQVNRRALNAFITNMKSKIKEAKNNYVSSTLPNFLNTVPQKFWSYLNPKTMTAPPLPLMIIETPQIILIDTFSQYSPSMMENVHT